MDTNSSFGYWIRRQRKARDLTQQALAERVGCSLAAIKKIEQDERRPSRQIANLLADVLGVPANQREVFLEVARGVRPVDQLLPMHELTTSTATQLEKSFPNNLPIQLTSFIGREKEIADVIHLLEKTRLVTLTGPGGTGKTRLSIQIANKLLDRYPDGVWLVELAPLSDPTLLPQVIVNTLSLMEQPSRPCMKVLIDFLKSKQALLILDNCEHLIQACAEIADGLLHACSKIRILTSSREPIGIAGETIYLVPSMTRPDIRNLPALESLKQYEAIQLFIDRATSAISTFILTEANASPIAQICQQLDGIPLAVELAAGKIRALSAKKIAQHLDDRFHLLTGGSRTALPRHQTLQAVIDWSYDLLSDEERRLFRQLSVFAGGWTFEAAETICSDLDILSLLTQLVNKSLVTVEGRGERKRYRFLETIRQYSYEKLFASDHGQRVRDRHLAFYLRFAEEAEPRLRSSEQVAWLERLETEYDNLRVALDWSLESGNSDHAVRLGGALGYYWEIRGDAREGCKWLDEALALCERERDERTAAGVSPTGVEILQNAKTLYTAGRLHFVSTFDPHEGRTKIEEALRISRQIGNRWLIAVALEHLGWMAILDGNTQAAYDYLAEGVSLARELEDQWPLAFCLLRLVSPLMRMDTIMANQIAEEGVRLARKLGDNYLLCYGLTHLAATHIMSGDIIGMEPVVEEALALARTMRSSYVTLSLFLLALLAFLQGNLVKAKEYSLQLWTRARETEYPFSVAVALIALGWIAINSGQTGICIRLLAASEAQFNKLGIKLDTYGGPIFLAYKQALQKAEAQVDRMTFERELQQGYALTTEQALALAMDSVLSD